MNNGRVIHFVCGVIARRGDLKIAAIIQRPRIFENYLLHTTSCRCNLRLQLQDGMIYLIMLNKIRHRIGLTTRVRNSDLGLCCFPFKCCVSQLSVDRFGENFEGVLTLGQVKNYQISAQRAEKRNI